MPKTILITGASTGIGRETANYFVSKGWYVAATMRTPEKAEGFVANDRLKLYRLDVLDRASIDTAIASAISDFGRIDVLLNNAGYGTQGPLEAATKEQIERQFDTNVIGLIAVMQSVIPHMKKSGGGTIINVSSIGGLVTLPFYSLYHGTKWAVEGLTESLSYEMAEVGIKMRIIEPGAIATDFGGRSLDVLAKNGLTDYDGMMARFKKARDGFVDRSSPASAVAKVIYEAATDTSDRLRYLVGNDAKLFARIRRWMGPNFTMRTVKRRLG